MTMSSCNFTTSSWTLLGYLQITNRGYAVTNQLYIASHQSGAFSTYPVAMEISGVGARMVVTGSLTSCGVVAVGSNAALVSTEIDFSGPRAGLNLQGGEVIVNGLTKWEVVFSNRSYLSGFGAITGDVIVSNRSKVVPCREVGQDCASTALDVKVRGALHFNSRTEYHIHIYPDYRQDRITAQNIYVTGNVLVQIDADEPNSPQAVTLIPALATKNFNGQFGNISTTAGRIDVVTYTKTQLFISWVKDINAAPVGLIPIEPPEAAPVHRPEEPTHHEPVEPWRPVSLPTWAIAIIAVIVVLLVVLIAVSIWQYCRRRRGRRFRATKLRRSEAEAKPLLMYNGDLGQHMRDYLEESNVPVVEPSEVEVIETIGSGATGVVLVGKWKATDELVAIKQISSSMLTAEGFTEVRGDALQQLVQEIKVMTQLMHPNLLPLLGCCVISDSDVRLRFCSFQVNVTGKKINQRLFRSV
jgi:hypothetical protein